MFAPVTLRFDSYGIELSKSAQAYVDRIKQRPLVQAWIEAARQESDILEFIDDLLPAAESPLTPGRPA